MQAHAVLDKSLVRVLRRASLDADRGASAHVIEKVVAVIDLRHAQEGQQLGIERARLAPTWLTVRITCAMPLTSIIDHRPFTARSTAVAGGREIACAGALR